MAKRIVKKKKTKKGASKRKTSGPGDDLRFKELERLINEIEQDAFEQRQNDSEFYNLPHALLSRLITVGIPQVTPDFGQFVMDVVKLCELLPQKAIAVQTLRNILTNPQYSASGVFRLFRECRWQTFNCPALTLDTRLIARLMLTDYPKDEGLEELTPPWDAFLIRLPEGLVEYDGVKYTGVLVHRYLSPGPPPLPADIPEDMRTAAAFMTQRQGVKWGIYGMSEIGAHLQGEARLAEHLGHAPRVSLTTPELPLGDPGEGVLALFARLAVGVCALVDDGDSLKHVPSTGSGTTEFTCDYRTSLQGNSSIETVKKYLHQLSLNGYSPPPIKTDLAALAAVREQNESEASKEPRVDASGRRRAARVITTDADPLSPFEEYIAAKYEGEDPDVIYECLVVLETEGLEKAAAATGKRQEWIEKWALLYGSEHVLRDSTLGDPFYRALIELAKLHPQDFSDLWEDEEAVQPELEAMPVGRDNAILCGFPFVRGRVVTPELARDLEISRQVRAVRGVRNLRVIK